jgi:hypothetical protein
MCSPQRRRVHREISKKLCVLCVSVVIFEFKKSETPVYNMGGGNTDATYPHNQPHDWRNWAIFCSCRMGTRFLRGRVPGGAFAIRSTYPLFSAALPRCSTAFPLRSPHRHGRAGCRSVRGLRSLASHRLVGRIPLWRILGAGTASRRFRWDMDHWTRRAAGLPLDTRWASRAARG